MSGLGNKEIMALNIKRFMAMKGVDRNTVCAALGIKYTTLTDWINAKTYPRIDKIEKLANYFGVDKSDLVEPEGLRHYRNQLVHSRAEYYTSPEVNFLAEYARINEGILLDASKDLTDEELESVINIVNQLRNKGR